MRENANVQAASTDSMGNRNETQDGRYFCFDKIFFFKIILFEILMFLGQELCDKLSTQWIKQKKKGSKSVLSFLNGQSCPFAQVVY